MMFLNKAGAVEMGKKGNESKRFSLSLNFYTTCFLFGISS